MINFRYRTLKKLGEGGTGEVYLVEDVLNQDRQSAMKILHGEDRSDRGAVEQFRQEVSVLALLEHPNLIRVFDFGLIRRSDDAALQGRPYFTMEYLQGANVQEWWRRHQSDEDRIAQLTRVLMQALGVLSYIHRRGIIHFDVKPGNFLLVPAGTPDNEFPLLKLTDFGFSATVEEALEFPLRGTLEYTAPEILRQEAFDHRADLYSLGATFYELIEDRCPFEAGDPVELIKKVLTTEPEFHRCNEEECAFLLPLLKNLLRKDPGERYPSAVEASGELLRHEQGMRVDLSDHFTKPGFVGREREKQVIASAIGPLTGSGGEDCGAIVVEGGEGLGKTALLDEMAWSARAAGLSVFEVRGEEGDPPFRAIASLLPFLRSEAMSRSAAGERLIERFAAVIGRGTQNDGREATESRVDWTEAKEKSIDALAGFLGHLSSLLPFVLVVDDAQFLDPESAGVLRTAVRDAFPDRMLLLAAAVGEGIPALHARRIRLEELDEQCVSDMGSEAVSPPEFGALLGRRLHQLYGGTPAIIVEALRSAGSMFTRDVPGPARDLTDRVEWVLRQLPRDIDELLLARYRVLDRERKLILDILSCFSLPSRLEIIQAALPFQPQRTRAYLSALESEGFLAALEGGRRFVFRHARLKSVVYSLITRGRDESHQVVASAIEGNPSFRTFADLQELAHQYRAGGEEARGLAWLEKAGAEGMKIAAYRTAKTLFADAVRIARDAGSSLTCSLEMKLAQALYQCGEYSEAAGLAESVLGKTAEDESCQGDLHKTAGLAHSRLGHYEESKGHIAAALRSPVDLRENVELQQELVGIEIATGNFADAERLCREQLVRAKDAVPPRTIASIHTDLGIAAFFQNLFDRAEEHFGEAMKIYASAGYHARVADAMLNIANVMSAKGEIVRAIEFWRKALMMSQEYGTLNQQAQIQNNLGIAHFKLKHYREAADYYATAKEMFARLDSRQGSAFVLTNLGEVCFAEGQYERAGSLWRDAELLYREMDDGQGIVETILQLAQADLTVGAVDSLSRDLDAAEALIDERGLDTFRFQLYFMRGMHLGSLGRHEEALAHFGRAELTPPNEGDDERRHLLRVRMAESEYRTGRKVQAVEHAREAKEWGTQMKQPQIVAGALYLLGTIAASSPAGIPEKPLPLFRDGFDAIAGEPVSELTWKLSLSLGEEYRKRGQRERAKECFAKARVVLRFFAEQFASSGLKNSYLMADDRQKILTALDAHVNT